MQREILKVRSYQNVLPIRKKVAAYGRKTLHIVVRSTFGWYHTKRM